MKSELDAILTRASIAEAQRQTAVQCDDLERELAAEAELAALAKRYRELSRRRGDMKLQVSRTLGLQDAELDKLADWITEQSCPGEKLAEFREVVWQWNRQELEVLRGSCASTSDTRH